MGAHARGAARARGVKRASSLDAFPRSPLRWVGVAPGVPYFQTEDGRPWHPIGQNDAISWRELNPLFRRRDVVAVERYLAMLASHGVTCMRLMLEYAQVRHRYFETEAGRWSRNMVQFWDDLLALCERHGIRILLTPFDTYWMWVRFQHHPYNGTKGGPLRHPSRALLSKAMREAIKARLTFSAERWGGSGALFAWDLWNEIHPAQAEMSAAPFVDFIEDLSTHVREVETRAFGRAHPQTVSLFGPELTWRAEMEMGDAIFRHPRLDFATIHIYEHGTIDDPKNTVEAAIGMGRIVRQSISEIRDGRPFLDTEHGPIHRFKDRRSTLPEPFDDEYFRHMQWAHLASGGAGGGMRWPNRKPHSLTAGMRVAQHQVAGFMPNIDWLRFDRENVSEAIGVMDGPGESVGPKRLARFGCASRDQAVVYLLRRDTLLRSGVLDRSAAPLSVSIRLPMLQPGRYRVTAWDTAGEQPARSTLQEQRPDAALVVPAFVGDVALAIRRVG